MRALITNDDGVDSPGLAALARVAVAAGLDTTVAAPSWDSSGASASLTAVEREGRFLVDERLSRPVPEARWYAVEAPPAFIVWAAAEGAFGEPPEVVLSGINLGPNLGSAILHSGTVGAVLTAATQGARGLAVSLGTGEPVCWETAAAVAGQVVPWLVDAEPRVVLNLNVPNVPLDEVRGLRRAHLAARGTVQATVTEVETGYVSLSFAGADGELEPGTDVALLAEGFACVTPLVAPCEARRVDTSDIAG